MSAESEATPAINIDVMPDGSALPEDSGTYAQGETLYADECAGCHGENLEGIKETAPRR